MVPKELRDDALGVDRPLDINVPAVKLPNVMQCDMFRFKDTHKHKCVHSGVRMLMCGKMLERMCQRGTYSEYTEHDLCIIYLCSLNRCETSRRNSHDAK